MRWVFTIALVTTFSLWFCSAEAEIEIIKVIVIKNNQGRLFVLIKTHQDEEPSGHHYFLYDLREVNGRISGVPIEECEECKKRGDNVTITFDAAGRKEIFHFVEELEESRYNIVEDISKPNATAPFVYKLPWQSN